MTDTKRFENKFQIAAVKAIYGDEIRRFPFEHVHNFNLLKKNICRVFEFAETDVVILRYRDDEDDLISMSTQMEYVEAQMSRNEKGIVRVFVSLRTKVECDGTNQSATSKKAECDGTNQTATNKESFKPEVSRDCASNFKSFEKSSSESEEKLEVAGGTSSETKQTTPGRQQLAELKANQPPRGSPEFWKWKQTMKRTKMSLRDQMPTKARFVKHENFEDGSAFEPGTPFEKVWRIRNDSERCWNAPLFLVPVGKESDRMGGPESCALTVQNGRVLPGEEICVKVPLVAPSQPGTYIGFWKLAMSEMVKFGQRLRVKIVVLSDSETDSGEASPSEETPEKDALEPSVVAALEQQLHSMGFVNQKLNTKLIKKFDGNLTQIVNKLMQKQKKMKK